MTSRPDAEFTLVIVAYHRADSLRRLLDRVTPTHRPAAPTPVPGPEIIVVNVDDDPEVAAIVGADDRIRLVPAANRGYAASVNLGARFASHDVIVFANDDIEPVDDAFETLARTVRDGVTDVAIPRLVDPNGTDEGTIRALPTPGRLFVEWAMTSDRPRADARTVQKWRRPSEMERVDAATAAVVAVPTSLLRRHPLPEDYFLYWEELDWFWRLRVAQTRVDLVPEAVVVHAGGRDDVRADKQRLLARNAVRCVDRTQGRAAAARAWPVVVLWQLRLLAVDTARTMVGRGSMQRVGARAAGVSAAAGAWREFAGPVRPGPQSDGERS